MIETTIEAKALPIKTSVPLPWDAFYGLGRQIRVGCAVTFGSLPMFCVVRTALARCESQRLIAKSPCSRCSMKSWPFVRSQEMGGCC